MRSRIINGTGLVVTGLVATLVALLFPLWSYEDRSGTGLDRLDAETVATDFGPLTALDRDFVATVRLAGLWELPAGRQAEERGATKAVRTAGGHLVEGHTFLDARVREVAARLRLELPNQPGRQQRQWLAGLSAARGGTYDEKFADILRRAHGAVFSVVAEVRANTRNSLVRTLADDANTTVLDHITVLEKTGLVDFDGLARDAAPDQAPRPAPPRRRAPPRHRPRPRRSPRPPRVPCRRPRPARSRSSPRHHPAGNGTLPTRHRPSRMLNMPWREAPPSHRTPPCSGSPCSSSPGPRPA